MPSPSRQPDGTFSHRDPRGGSADEAARIAAFGGLIGAMKVSTLFLFHFTSCLCIVKGKMRVCMKVMR